MNVLPPRKRSISGLLLIITSGLVFSTVSAQSPSSPLAAARTDDEKRTYRTAMGQADQKIVDEVNAHSELMKNLEYLSDVIGPRLTASPNMMHACEWTRDTMTKWGLQNAHLEAWPFGRGGIGFLRR